MSNKEIKLAVRQVIDQALITGEVIDLYDASGLKIQTFQSLLMNSK